MKKYLFLFILFFVYLILVIKPKTMDVISFNSKYSIDEFYIKFNNGLNSKKINLLLENYNDDYLIKEISIKNHQLSVFCNEFKECINDVYRQFDNDFEIENIVNGFKINKILIVTNYEQIKKSLDLEKINYNIIEYKKNSY